MRKYFIGVLPFLASIWVHLAAVLVVLAFSHAQTGQSDQAGPGGKGGTESEATHIIPKSIEIEVVEPEDDKGDMPMQAKPETPSEGIKECEGDKWFGGIGVQMSGFSNGGEEIGEVFPGYPADKVGLQKGDVVRFVDGQPYNFGEIRGEPGTSLILTIYRPSTNETQDLFIVRDKICTER